MMPYKKVETVKNLKKCGNKFRPLKSEQCYDLSYTPYVSYVAKPNRPLLQHNSYQTIIYQILRVGNAL